MAPHRSRVAGWARRRRHASKPSMRGITTSIRIQVGPLGQGALHALRAVARRHHVVVALVQDHADPHVRGRGIVHEQDLPAAAGLRGGEAQELYARVAHFYIERDTRHDFQCGCRHSIERFRNPFRA